MEDRNKRRKPNDYYVQDDEEVPFASNSQATNNFDGQGISAYKGKVAIGGDFIVHNNKSDQRITKDDKRILLESLRFDQIDDRQRSIRKAHPKTCRWLLRNPQYLNWLDTNKLRDHNGFLWIKGKPGAGKSTLMNFVVSHTRETMKQKMVISFFLNARGDNLEKSTIGLYRSLLLQLLEACSDLQSKLGSIRVGHKWTVESLKTLFEKAILYLGESSLICFIDALDECEESQIRDMVSFLSELVTSTETRLHICFASRYYPHITISKGLSFELENQEEHRQDIISYVSSALNIGDGKLAEQIRSDLQEKASGVFMWVVLVVDILNKEYDQGRKHTLSERLKSIPSGLHDLFHDILTRDKKNAHGLLLCIQWVLYARNPLTPNQLYFAILSGLEPDNLSSCHSDEISGDDIRKYILDNSKGLAEYTKSEIPTVQFIHESVRDFFLKEKGLEAIWPNFGANLTGQSHETLKNCCVTYMRSEPVIHLHLPSTLPKATFEQAEALRQNLNERFPFLEYANQNILYHANEAESHGVSQKDFLPDFSITEWLNNHNLFETNQMCRYSSKVSLSYILAEGDMSALIRMQASSHSCFAVESERYGTPIFAALATKSNRAVQAFLEVQEKNQPLDSTIYEVYRPNAEDGAKDSKFSQEFIFSRLRGVVSHIAEYGNETILAFIFATEKVDVNLNDEDGRTPLSWAAASGNEVSVQLLLEKGARIEIEDRDSRTPLSYAAENGNEATVRLLLERGARIEAQDNNGQTPLLYAVGLGNEATVQLLLENGAEVEVQNKNGETPLLYAVRIGSIAHARLLLDKGARIEAQDNNGRTPLSWAAWNKNEVSMQLLLEKGARIEAEDNNGQTPLLYAVGHRNEATMQQLLENGAEVEAQNKNGETPLLYAARIGSFANARLLLEKGALVEAQDNNGRTPLSWAAGHLNKAIVLLLLEKGARIEAQDKDRRTPLSYAVKNGNEANVRLLLENGAEFEFQEKGGRRPLSYVVENEDEASVQLFLEMGAEAKVQDKDGRTPLSYAAENGDEVSVRQLLENGAEIEVQDKDGRTPLFYAAVRGFTNIFQLLQAKRASYQQI